jgi:hypothetical protein
MTYQTLDGVTHIAKIDARAGRRVKGMTTVLAVSSVAAAILLALAIGFFV